MTSELSLTPEQLEKAKAAPSAAALFALAQENGIALTAEEAETLYTQLHAKAGAITDEELDKVAGGWEDDLLSDTLHCPKCYSTGWYYRPQANPRARYGCTN